MPEVWFIRESHEMLIRVILLMRNNSCQGLEPRSFTVWQVGVVGRNSSVTSTSRSGMSQKFLVTQKHKLNQTNDKQGCRTQPGEQQGPAVKAGKGARKVPRTSQRVGERTRYNQGSFSFLLLLRFINFLRRLCNFQLPSNLFREDLDSFRVKSTREDEIFQMPRDSWSKRSHQIWGSTRQKKW